MFIAWCSTSFILRYIISNYKLYNYKSCACFKKKHNWVFSFLNVEVKIYLALVEKSLLKRGYIRIIIQKTRINFNSRDIIETYFAYFKWGRETK
jgi:hypothetical protein